MDLESDSNFEFRPSDKRVEIYRNVLENLKPLTSYKSDAPVIDEAARMGVKYVSRMRDKKKELEEIDSQIQELRERKREIRQKWETDQLKFEDL